MLGIWLDGVSFVTWTVMMSAFVWFISWVSCFCLFLMPFYVDLYCGDFDICSIILCIGFVCDVCLFCPTMDSVWFVSAVVVLLVMLLVVLVAGLCS